MLLFNYSILIYLSIYLFIYLFIFFFLTAFVVIISQTLHGTFHLTVVSSGQNKENYCFVGSKQRKWVKPLKNRYMEKYF